MGVVATAVEALEEMAREVAMGNWAKEGAESVGCTHISKCHPTNIYQPL